MNSWIRNIVLLLSVLLSVWGCTQLPKPAENFERIKRGMPKYDVLELLGTPRRSERVKGQDHWTYVFHTKTGYVERVVLFEDGKVIYAGKEKSKN